MRELASADAASVLYAALVARLMGLALVSLRLAPVALVTPLFGGRALPPQARGALFVALALGLFPASMYDASRVPALPGPSLALAAFRELAVGSVFALVVAVPFFALEHAGRLLDVARGANAAEVTAPDSGARSSPLAELLRWTFTVTFVAAGGLRAVLRAFSATLVLAPPGLTGPVHTAALAERAMRAASDSLSAGFALGAAGLVALFAVEAALALTSRIAPALAQAQLALPLRALAPLAALALAASAWTGAAHELARGALAVASTLAP